MKEVYVQINSVEKVKGLIGKLRSIEGDFDLVDGRTVIDAKSFLGILSMDLEKPVKLVIHEEKEDVMGVLEEYFVPQQ